jgi:cytochrome c oxidase subunit 2
MKQIPTSLWTLVAGILITLISLWVGQNHGLLPLQASEQAAYVDQLFSAMVTIATAFFIVVEGAILFSAIRFRRPAGDNTDGPPIEGNVPLEIFWTLIPAVIVVGLGVYSVDVYEAMGGFGVGHSHGMPELAQHAHHSQAQLVSDGEMMPEDMGAHDTYGFGMDPSEEGVPPDLVVNVTGMQYAWLFDYPKEQLGSGELHVPVNADVQLNLAAADVIHSFWVPEFRLKQDAIPGQRTQLRFRATRVGEYPVVCAELCGSYHGGMRTIVVVHEPEDYQQWVKDNVLAQAPTPTPGSEFAQELIDRFKISSESLAQVSSQIHS